MKEKIMRPLFTLLSLSVLMSVSSVVAAQTTGGNDPVREDLGRREVRSVDSVVDLIIAREHHENVVISAYRPIVETYAQKFSMRKNGEPVLSSDYYYLGQATLAESEPLAYHSMLTVKDQIPKKGFVDEGFHPIGFVHMAYLDRQAFDRQHYEFKYVGQEFLGDVRCVVFDVKPLPNSGIGRFYGRIYAEDKNYTVVRFNGIYLPVRHKGYNSHFDSWRLNVQPDLWLPAYAFAEEMDLKIHRLEIKHVNDHERLRFKAQTRFWGFNLQPPEREQEFTSMTVDGASAAGARRSDQQLDSSPVQAQRQWQTEAENNVLSALQQTGLLTPQGQVDKTLDGVINNLEVTNNLDIDPPVRCRVLTTATFDLFEVGHVIVISRGLLDVLPDEATLAALLAQQLGEILVAKSSAERYAFYDTVQTPSLDALKHFSFRLDERERAASSEKALIFLQNSPYKDKLANAGLFLKEFDQDSRTLRALVAPHLGDRLYVAAQIIALAPALESQSVNQVAALPLGARIKLDPWSDEIELTKSKPVTLISSREKMPLEVTPFMPYLTRYAATSASQQTPNASANENGSPSPPRANK
jgi:hypothetical protein